MNVLSVASGFLFCTFIGEFQSRDEHVIQSLLHLENLHCNVYTLCSAQVNFSRSLWNTLVQDVCVFFYSLEYGYSYFFSLTP